MIYVITNRIKGELEYFDDAIIPNAMEVAQQKLDEYTKAYLEQEKIRFHIARVEHNDIGERWFNLTDNEPEVADYRVLDQYTGTYSNAVTLTDALALVEQRKQQFIASLGDKVSEYIPPVEPTTQENIAKF